jgi:hypothetical protein
MKSYWEIIADNLKKARCSWGRLSAVDSEGRTFWIANARRDDGQRFIVHADEKLTAFVELEAAIRGAIATTIGYRVNAPERSATNTLVA